MAQTANVSEVFVSFQGEGVHVGRRHLFVRFGGCPLRCRYCDTPESLVPVPECRVDWGGEVGERLTNPLTAECLEALVGRRAARERGLHALALTGGEPLASSGFLAEWLPNRGLRLPVLLETAAIHPSHLARIVRWVDIVSADIKLPSNSGEPARWREHEECLRMCVDRDLYVKIPVDDGTDLDELETAVRLVASVDSGIPTFLQPIADPEGRLQVRGTTLDLFHRRAADLGVDVRVVPQTHKTLGIL